MTTIEAVKAKLEQLKPGLPAGVEVVTTYDRSQLIERAVRNLRDRLVEEFIVVALVCALFLFHLRSAFVAVVALPVGILTAFIVMHYQGVNANIMSLGGIAIAVGAMVDAAVVMIENAHKHLEAFRHAAPGRDADGRRNAGRSSATPRSRWVRRCSSRCSSSRCRSFRCSRSKRRRDGCSRRSPLRRRTRWPRRPGLSVTLVPVLMGYLIRGRIPDESRNPLNRALIAVYRPVLRCGAALPEGDDRRWRSS